MPLTLLFNCFRSTSWLKSPVILRWIHFSAADGSCRLFRLPSDGTRMMTALDFFTPFWWPLWNRIDDFLPMTAAIRIERVYSTYRYCMYRRELEILCNPSSYRADIHKYFVEARPSSITKAVLVATPAVTIIGISSSDFNFSLFHLDTFSYSIGEPSSLTSTPIEHVARTAERSVVQYQPH